MMRQDKKRTKCVPPCIVHIENRNFFVEFSQKSQFYYITLFDFSQLLIFFPGFTKNIDKTEYSFPQACTSINIAKIIITTTITMYCVLHYYCIIMLLYLLYG